MAETKDEIAADRDRLAAENESLRAQLAAGGAATGRAAVPQYTFQLSEGDRQELEIRGVVNVGGRLMTKDDVLKAMAAAGQRGVTIADAPEATRVDARVLKEAQDREARGGVRGFDYVYPSVAPGKIDPAVAGTPGISGPAADAADVSRETVPADADADAEGE